MVATIQHENHAERMRELCERYEQQAAKTATLYDTVFGVFPIQGTSSAEVPPELCPAIPSTILELASHEVTAVGIIKLGFADLGLTARLYYATPERVEVREAIVTIAPGFVRIGEWHERANDMYWLTRVFKDARKESNDRPHRTIQGLHANSQHRDGET